MCVLWIRYLRPAMQSRSIRPVRSQLTPRPHSSHDLRRGVNSAVYEGSPSAIICTTLHQVTPPTTMHAGLRLASALLLVASIPTDALVVRNASPVTLPFARRLNLTGTANLLQIDQARAKALKERAMTSPGKFIRTPIDSVPATSQVANYVVSVRLRLLAPYTCD